MSWLDQIEKAPEDPILGITLAYNADTSKDKINLGVGAYRDDNGNPYVLSVIQKVKETNHIFFFYKKIQNKKRQPGYSIIHLERITTKNTFQFKDWINSIL